MITAYKVCNRCDDGKGAGKEVIVPTEEAALAIKATIEGSNIIEIEVEDDFF